MQPHVNVSINLYCVDPCGAGAYFYELPPIHHVIEEYESQAEVFGGSLVATKLKQTPAEVFGNKATTEARLIGLDDQGATAARHFSSDWDNHDNQNSKAVGDIQKCAWWTQEQQEQRQGLGRRATTPFPSASRHVGAAVNRARNQLQGLRTGRRQ